MSPSPKKKRKSSAELTDAELAEQVFGKRLKKELDKVLENVDKKGVPNFMGT